MKAVILTADKQEGNEKEILPGYQLISLLMLYY